MYQCGNKIKLWIRHRNRDLNTRDCKSKFATYKYIPLEDSSSCSPHISVYLISRDTEHPLNYLLKNICVVNNLGKQGECLPPEQRPHLLRTLKIMMVSSCWTKAGVLLLPVIKDVGSPNSVFLSCNATYFVSMSPAFFILIFVNRGLETQCKTAGTLATVIM